MTVAFGAEIPAWKVDVFASDRPLDGFDGWSAGYPGDAWFGVDQGAWAASFSDDNLGDDELDLGYGSGWAADNWLIHGPAIGQVSIVAGLGTSDDDCMGVVFAHNGSDTFYLVGWSNDALPPPYKDRASAPRLFVLRVEDVPDDLGDRILTSIAADKRPSTILASWLFFQSLTCEKSA
jgi:hypothetical protein